MNARSVLPLLLLPLFTAVSPAADPATVASDAVAEEIRRLADGLHARGMDDLAIPEYQRILKEHPDYTQVDVVLFRLAESFRRSGRKEEAEFFYRRLTQRFPRSPYRWRAELRLGDMLEEAGRLEEASDAFAAAQAGAPPPESKAAAAYRLGRIRRALKDPGGAEQAWRAAMAAAPDAPLAALAALELADLLDADSAAGQAEAQKLLESVALGKTAETAAEALARLFRRHYARGEFAEAAARFDELTRRFPDAPRRAELERPAAWALLRAGRAAAAAEMARGALATLAGAAPETADEWRYLLANAERARGNAAAADAVYAELLERHPESPFAPAAAYEWALLAFQRGDPAETLRRAARARSSPELAEDLDWLLGESYAAAGHADEALKHFMRIAEAAPPGPRAAEALYRVARALEDRGDRIGAAAAFAGLSEKWPDHPLAPAARAAAAACRAREERWAEALADWTALIERYPKDPLAEEARFRKAAAEMALGRDAEALASLEDLLRRHPASRFAVESRYWRAVLLERRGDFAAAEAELRAAAELRPDAEWSARLDHRRAALLQRLGRVDEAERLLRRLLETPLRADLAPEVLEWLARRALEEGDAAAAARAAEPLAGPAAPAAWRPVGAYLLGRAQEAVGRKREAAAHYAVAAAAPDLTRDRADALRRWAALLAEAGDLDAAHARYTELAEQTAGADHLLDLRARALRGLADIAERRNQWEEAARLHTAIAVLFDDPELTPDSLRRGAECYRRLGAEDRADQLLRELAERYPDHR